MPDAPGKRASRRRTATALILGGVVCGMVGLAFGAVPLYKLFCQVTGFGGTTQVAEEAPVTIGERVVTVRFNADTARDLPWHFKPEQREITVRVGEMAMAFYNAVNQSDRSLVGSSTFNVTPVKAGAYFNKIECFCFEEQTLAPGERAELTVRSAGVVELVIGTQPTGQGQETSFAQVAADLLGVSVDAVRVVMGDTDIVKAGGGSHSGRSMRQAATIIHAASRQLVARAKAAAAVRFGVAASEVSFEDGVFRGTRAGQSADWFELAGAGDLTVVREHEFDEPVFPNGCAACELEVDPETRQGDLVWASSSTRESGETAIDMTNSEGWASLAEYLAQFAGADE